MVFRNILLGILSIHCAFAQQNPTYSLKDFYSYHPDLEQLTDAYFEQLNDTLKVGQMIVQAAGRLGRSDEHIQQLVEKGYVGGILLLNGDKAGFTQMVSTLDSLGQTRAHLPLIYSADAEPSLIYRKIKDCAPVPKNNEIKSDSQSTAVAASISHDLLEIGIRQNYAPIIDVPVNKAIIGNRGFEGSDSARISMAKAFIHSTQDSSIVATAKHFPGHGFVKGDTHKELVFIDGEMKELSNYVPLIESGILSIMVGHIAVKNNKLYATDGLPSTCSRKIVTDLLKDSLQFKGLVVTDAMGMKANDKVKNAPLKAVQAGNDMILMPKDEKQLILDVLAEMKDNQEFRQQVYASVRKIIRLKICLGLLN